MFGYDFSGSAEVSMDSVHRNKRDRGGFGDGVEKVSGYDILLE